MSEDQQQASMSNHKPSSSTIPSDTPQPDTRASATDTDMIPAHPKLTGLPPELRTEIWKSVLLTHIPHRGVHPNLLAVTKQIHFETKPIFDENVVHVDLSSDESDPMEEVSFTAHVHTSKPLTATWEYLDHDFPDGQAPHAEPRNGPTVWPLYLSNVSKLCIRITANAPDLPTMWWSRSDSKSPLWQLSHALWSLGSFFENQGHRLDELRIEVELIGDGVEEIGIPRDDSSALTTAPMSVHGLTAVQTMLWQLGRIGKVEDLKISGLSPANETFLRTRLMAMPSNRRLSEKDRDAFAAQSGRHDASHFIGQSLSLLRVPLRRTQPPIDGNTLPPIAHPEPYKGDDEAAVAEHDDEYAKWLGVPILTLASQLPSRPDLLDKLWALNKEVEARYHILPLLNLVVVDEDGKQSLPGDQDAWIRGTRLVSEERLKEDPVDYAHDGISQPIMFSLIGPFQEQVVDEWSGILEERLDDFFDQLRDGRLPAPTQEQIDEPAFQEYLAARDERLAAMDRVRKRAALRAAAMGSDGLPASVFMDPEPWHELAREQEAEKEAKKAEEAAAKMAEVCLEEETDGEAELHEGEVVVFDEEAAERAVEPAEGA